jgi:hypothetical protein
MIGRRRTPALVVTAFIKRSEVASRRAATWEYQRRTTVAPQQHWKAQEKP